jgi:hypothetical protein
MKELKNILQRPGTFVCDVKCLIHMQKSYGTFWFEEFWEYSFVCII